MAARTSIASGQDNVTRHLPFHVEVELLNAALFEVEVLRLNSTRERAWVRRAVEDWNEPSGDTLSESERIERGGIGTTSGGERWTTAEIKAEEIGFGKVRGIFPEALG